MNLKMFSVTAAVGAMLVASPAMAGFTAFTGTDVFSYSGSGLANLPATGGVITVTNQSFATYTPDDNSPGSPDPQISGGDLQNYRYNFTLNVGANIPGAGGSQTVLTSGTYSIVYDANLDGTPEASVSSGNASLFLTLDATGNGTAAGFLTQTAGPSNPAFADLSYGSPANIVLSGGVYAGVGPGGTIELTLRQNVVVPEPTTVAALAGVGAIALRRRRRA